MKRIYTGLIHYSWVFLVLFLPITSFALLSKAMGGTDVAPLSLVFLGVMVLIWLLPQLVKGMGLPMQSIPLILFVLFALVSCAIAFFLPIPTFKGSALWKTEFKDIFSLVIGVCFYLVISLYLDDSHKLGTFFKWVNISGAAALVYCLFQGAFVFLIEITPEAFWKFQAFVSSSGTFFYERVNGLAYEPSWLAHQLNIFYLPIWLGLSLKKVSFQKLHLGKITLENILLALGIFVLFLTKSRIGWLACLTSFGYLFLRWMDVLRGKTIARMDRSWSRGTRVFANFLFWLLVLGVILGAVLLAGWVFTKIDPRMEQLFDIQEIRDKGILGWASNMLFAERIVYWMAGFSTFLEHPLFGVGLGNSGYYFPQVMNSIGYGSPEIMGILLQNPGIPNVKSLWMRLLAETGIVGFSLFVSWLWVGWKSARALEKVPEPIFTAVGMVGQLTIVALLVEGFSIDSFALPYVWMSLGLAVAALRVMVKEKVQLDQE